VRFVTKGILEFVTNILLRISEKFAAITLIGIYYKEFDKN